MQIGIWQGCWKSVINYEIPVLCAGIHAVSITYSYRITLTLKITEKGIILLDIGSHDEVYR